MFTRSLFLALIVPVLWPVSEIDAAEPPPAQTTAAIAPAHPTCEYIADPLGIDTAKPRFSWQIESQRRGQVQSAYHILVASTREKLQANQGDVWDSGKVQSSQSVNVPYDGRPLASHQRLYWKVRVWDRDGRPSSLGPVASFEMGLLAASDWKARWISRTPPPVSTAGQNGRGAKADADKPTARASGNPLLRTEVDIRRDKVVRRARAYISGLGWFELYINGQRVGDHVLDPVMSNYAKRVYYVTHDVGDYLHVGRNAVGVMLGNGWFSQPGRLRYGTQPVLLAQIEVEYADGSVETFATDDSWKTSDGPIVENAIQRGETYDARLEKPGWAATGYDAGGWSPAHVVPGPGGALSSQLQQPIRVVADLTPVSCSRPKPGVFVFDLGQVFGGWTRLHVKGEAGTRVTLQYSERIQRDSGLVDKTNHPAPLQTDVYILKGDPTGEVFEPRFTFHPVRYVQIEGYPGQPMLTDLVGRVVHTDVDLSGGFRCSNPLLNRIAHITDWTVWNSWFGTPIDCLHREPFAYLEPSETPSHLYNRKFMPQFWMKWLRDVQTEQRDDGAIPVVIPNYPKHTSTDPAWSGNYPIAVWYLSQYYEAPQLLAEHYDNMKRWVEYLRSTAKGHLILKGTWGDHMAPGPKPGEEEYVSTITPSPLLWTGYYYRDVSILAQAAALLGKSDDAAQYSKLADEIKSALNAEWFDSAAANYAKGSQTANAFALALSVVPEDKKEQVAKNLIRDIADTHQGRLTTGIIGLTSLVETLADHGGGDTLYNVVNRTDYPGWGYMIGNGATTLWESWGQVMRTARGREESMAMFSTILEFLYSDVAGLHGPSYFGPNRMVNGFGTVRIRPLALGDLESAQSTIKTTRGEVSSSWRRRGKSIVVGASIPGNCQATVSVPTCGIEDVVVEESGSVVWRDGKFVSGVEGIAGARRDLHHVTFDVGSGNYAFHLSER